jgi:oligosaccharide amylase
MGRSYFNDGITGNGRLLVSFTGNGEVNRVFWPEQDYAQQINNIFIGIKFDNDYTKFLHENLWYIEQRYEKKTNILVTMYENSDFGLRIFQKDFVLNNKDIWVRNYTIENICDRKLDIKTFLHTDFVTADNDIRSGLMDFDNDSAIIYNKGNIVTISSDKKISGFQFGDSFDAIRRDGLYGKDDISMTSNMALRFDLGELLPGEKTEFSLYFSFSFDMKTGRELNNHIRDLGAKKALEKEKKFWDKEFQKYSKLETGNERIDEVYYQAVLTFKLLTNKDTGAILAGVEVDERFTRCGAYGYCWPRDGVFITMAFDICGMREEAEKFYLVWAKKAQLPNGSWQQRYYLDGKLAPSWGIQLDETASIIFGTWKHYEFTNDIQFIEDMWSSIKPATIFLMNNLDKETGLPNPSYDLWEERLGEHTYTASAVVSALRAAASMAEEMKVDLPLAKLWRETSDKIVKSIEANLWSEDEKRFLRGRKTKLDWWNGETLEIDTNKMGYKLRVVDKDNTVDISLLGLSVPFKIFDAKDDRIKKTVRAIEDRLDGFPSEGFGRYEHDSYIGGNPWIVSTLWMGLYYAEIGDIPKCKEKLVWATKHATNLGFLPEQVDKFNGKPAWIMQLSWSSAMYIVVLNAIRGFGKEGD